MADRVYVMCDGRITGCIDYEDVSQEAIMQLATLENAQGAQGNTVSLDKSGGKTA